MKITYYYRNFTRAVLAEYKQHVSKQGLTQYQLDLIHGNLLGDATIPVVLGNGAHHIKFEQKEAHRAYVDWLYYNLSPFVGTPPQKRLITGGGAKDRASYWFKTYSFPFITDLYKKFYPVYPEGLRKKVIPDDIYSILNNVVLAYLYMGDGTARISEVSVKNRPCSFNSIKLNTQGFTIEDQMRLIQVLQDKFGLICSLQKDKSYYRISIKTESGAKFFSIIGPHIHPDFFYKIPREYRSSLSIAPYTYEEVHMTSVPSEWITIHPLFLKAAAERLNKGKSLPILRDTSGSTQEISEKPIIPQDASLTENQSKNNS